MAFKFICLTALIAVASAQYQVGYPAAIGATAYQPSPYKPTTYKPNYEGPSDYTFNYEVNDPTTYDVKSQSEYSKDGYVAGSYSLIDADGLRRTVDYTADDYNGFQATVRREPVGSYGGYYGVPNYAAVGYQGVGYPRYQAGYAYGPGYGAYGRYQTPYTGYSGVYGAGQSYGAGYRAY